MGFSLSFIKPKGVDVHRAGNWAQTVPNTQHFTYLRGLFFVLNLIPEHIILSRADWYCCHIWQRAAVVRIFTCPEIVTLETNEIQSELYFSASTTCPSANRYQLFCLRDWIFSRCVTSILFRHRLTLFTVKLLISTILSTNISSWRAQYKEIVKTSMLYVRLPPLCLWRS